MRRTIFDLFAKSPFGPMQDHVNKIMECVRLIPDLFRAIEAGDEEQIRVITEKVQKAEFEADEIKNQIRSDMPSTIFTPVDRDDLVDVLSYQDHISDVAEDVVVLYGMKNLPFPESIREPFWKFLDQVMVTVEQYAKVSGTLDELMKASFGGAQAGKVLAMIATLGEMEHEADLRQAELLRKLLSLEEELGALDIMLWMRIFQCVGDIANGAEKVGNRLRLFLSK